MVLLAGILSSADALSFSGRLFIDWLTYSHAVQRWLTGLPIYGASQLAGPYYLPDVVLSGFAYPPATVPFFLPFASAPLGLLCWIVLNLGVFITGVVAVLRRELGAVSLVSIGLLLAVLGISGPLTVGVAAGNVNVALAGILAWSWAVGRSARFVPLSAMVATVIKLTPASLMAWGDRRPRRYLAQAALVLLIVLLTVPLTGAAAWHDFATALSNSQPTCHIPGALPSIPCALEAILGSAELARMVSIVVFVGLSAIAWWTRSPLAAFLMVTVAWMVPTADVHPHSLLVPLVGLLVLGLRVHGRLVASRHEPGRVVVG